MQIFLIVIQLLQVLAPAIARVLAAINESQGGGIKEYDRLVAIAMEQVKIVAAGANAVGAMPGGADSGWERNLRLYAQAIYLTIDAAQAAGIAVKDHQVSQAVSDAYTAWKMTSAKPSEPQPTP